MRVSVLRLIEIEGHFVAEVALDSLHFSSEIFEVIDPPIRGLDIKDPDFIEVLDRAGVLKQFGVDFWAFRDGKGKGPPWEYPEINSDLIAPMFERRTAADAWRKLRDSSR
jgi:hypothetical protein